MTLTRADAEVENIFKGVAIGGNCIITYISNNQQRKLKGNLLAFDVTNKTCAIADEANSNARVDINMEHVTKVERGY
jgi:hypothetical protein